MKRIWLMLSLALVICFSLYAEKLNVRGNFDKKIINAVVITDKKCPFCIISPTEEYLKKILPGINFDIIDYRNPKAKKLIKKYNINSLPSFIIPDTVENKAAFSRITAHAKKKDGYFILSRELSGEFMLLDRKSISSRIDVFFSLYDRNLGNVLKVLRKFCKDKKISFGVHILNERRNNPLEASAQREETERLLAVEMVYPRKFWNYFTKRLDNINSTLWFDDMESVGINYGKIRKLVHSKEIKSIINDSSMFSHELGITGGIVVLINNRMIFRVYDIEKSDLEKIMKYAQHK